jgi:hypothetical protein
VSVSYGDQKEIEGTGLRAELIDIALTDQALIHPAELLGHFAESGQRNRLFVHSGYLL